MKDLPMKLSHALVVFLLLPGCISAQQNPKGFELVYEQSFADDNPIGQFRFTQPEKWLVSEGKSDKALEFTGISDYQPPFRSPHTIGLIGDLMVGSFALEADFLQTGKEYGHRDMVIVFGFQDPSHFYYSHIATKMDDNAHQIMLVNNAPRTKISTFTTEGVDWGDKEWHKVRIERNIEDGTTKVFFNGKLIQETKDKTFAQGYIGFGSFDDSGKIDNIKIWAKDADKKSTTVFSSK